MKKDECGLNVSGSCYWDNDTDGSLTIKHENEAIIGIVHICLYSMYKWVIIPKYFQNFIIRIKLKSRELLNYQKEMNLQNCLFYKKSLLVIQKSILMKQVNQNFSFDMNQKKKTLILHLTKLLKDIPSEYEQTQKKLGLSIQCQISQILNY